MANRLVVHGGTVLTLGRRTPNHPEADVMIEGGRIVTVGDVGRSRNADVVDARGCVLIPGFVDTQRAAWTTLTRNVVIDDRGEHDTAATNALTADDLYSATRLSLINALESGITTAVDWCDLPLDEATADAVWQAHQDTPIRSVAVSADAPARSLDRVATAQHDRATDRHSNTLHHIAHCSFALNAGDLESWRSDLERARQQGRRVFAPLAASRTSNGQAPALRHVDATLGADVTLLHATGLSDPDLDVIAKSPAGLCITPARDLAQGLGLPPLQRLLDRDIRPGLGTGDHRLSPADMFAQMQAVQSLQHAAYFDLKLAGKAGLPNLLTTRAVIRFATLDGAAAIGLDDHTGSIEVGKRADLVVLRADAINVHPINDPIGAVVWAMDPSNVDTVIVDGEIVVRDGAYIGPLGDLRSAVLAASTRLATMAVGGGRS